MKIDQAQTDAEIGSCYAVLKQLRPKLVEKDFVSDVRRMSAEGFRLVRLSDPDVRAVAGYRLMELFATGRSLYVDDLVTDSAHRSRGYGKRLLDWLIAEAQRASCRYLELDSGVKRVDAHRFYVRNGLEEIGLHFSIPVDGGPKWTSD